MEVVTKCIPVDTLVLALKESRNAFPAFTITALYNTTKLSRLLAKS
jgi:hypothetical protein